MWRINMIKKRFIRQRHGLHVFSISLWPLVSSFISTGEQVFCLGEEWIPHRLQVLFLSAARLKAERPTGVVHVSSLLLWWWKNHARQWQWWQETLLSSEAETVGLGTTTPTDCSRPPPPPTALLMDASWSRHDRYLFPKSLWRSKKIYSVPEHVTWRAKTTVLGTLAARGRCPGDSTPFGWKRNFEGECTS